MKGTQFKIIMMTVTMALAFSGTAFSIDRHQDQHRLKSHQMDRIHDGIAKGVITDKEYQKLQKEQQQLRKATKKARADGKITRKEKKHLSTLKRKSDKHIYRAKHNHHKRNIEKNRKYLRNHHKNPRHDPYPPGCKYDDHYKKPHYRQNDVLFSGAWMKPFWGFSFYTRDQCRR